MKSFDKPIHVARPFLPPLPDFSKGLQEIWGNHRLTNNGPIVQRFGQELSNYFETDNDVDEKRIGGRLWVGQMAFGSLLRHGLPETRRMELLA